MNMAEDMDMNSHVLCHVLCLSSSMDHGRGQELLVKEALHIQMTLQRNVSTEMEDWKSLVAGPL